MTVSRKHHYIPKFYLKGFTDSSNMFAIFDIEKNVLKSKSFSTKSHFYEIDRNTFVIDNKADDFLEQFYQKIEDKVKNTFFEIQNSNGSIEITPFKILDIQLFILTTYWRIPITDGKIEDLFKLVNPSELWFQLINRKTGESAPKDSYDKLMNDPVFIESYRAAFPLLQMLKRDEPFDLENWRIYFSKTGGKHICGDFPIIFRDPEKNDIITDEFIFPLTKKQLLVRTKNKIFIREFPPEFSLMIDILIFLQSKKYVCCSDKYYLEELSKLRNDYIENPQQLTNYVFSLIDKNN